MMMPATTNHILNRTEEDQLLQLLASGEINAFWQIFQQHRDYLFRCCLKWMNGNSTEAEEMVSQAMVKVIDVKALVARQLDGDRPSIFL